LEAARDACLAEPNRAEAHYAYGQAWAAAGNAGAGRAGVRRRCQAAPRLRRRLGQLRPRPLCARRDRRRQEAPWSAPCRRSPAIPRRPAIWRRYLRLTGSYEAAETLLREALARDPHDAGARLNLVAEKLQEEKPAEALALLNEVDPPADNLPAARHWHLQRALALIVAGPAGQARAALAECDALGPAPPELRPMRLWRDVLLALAEGRRAEARACRRARWRRRSNRWDRARCSNTGSWRATTSPNSGRVRAMTPGPSRNGARATRCCGRSSRSRATRRGLISTPRSRPSRPSVTLPARARKTPIPAPVFIVGMPRSGTTLAEQILAAHPQAHGAGERSALGRLAWRLGGGETPESIARIAALDQATLDAEAEAYLTELHALAPDKAASSTRCRATSSMSG
jgi:tetratricopeptide (TPR) repeat protein